MDDSNLQHEKIIISYKENFQEIDQKLELGNLEKRQLKEDLNQMKIQFQNFAPIKILNEFKSIYQTQRNGDQEGNKAKFENICKQQKTDYEEQQKNIEAIKNELQQQSVINEEVKSQIEQKYQEEIKMITSKNDEIMGEFDKIRQESMNKNQKVQTDLTGIYEQLEILSVGIKKESQRLKDMNEKFEKKFILEAEISERKIIFNCEEIGQKMARDLTSFFDQRCLKMIQAQTIQKKDEDKEEEDEDSILTNQEKFKKYLQEQIVDHVNHYIKDNEEFQCALVKLINEHISDEKKLLQEQLFQISNVRKFIDKKLSEQHIQLEQVSTWMVTNRNDIDSQLKKIYSQSEDISRRTDQINEIKSNLDLKIQQMNELAEEVLKKINRVSSQQIQLRSDQDIQNEFMGKQIKFLNKEKDRIDAQMMETMNWLTVLHEGLNVSLCVLFVDTEQEGCAEFIAIPTFLDGILLQRNSNQQKDEISFRMNKFSRSDLVYHTLVALQEKYKDFISGILQQQILMRCLDFFRINIQEKSQQGYQRKMRPSSLKKEHKLTEIDIKEINISSLAKSKRDGSQEKYQKKDRLMSTTFTSMQTNTVSFTSPSQERIHTQSGIQISFIVKVTKPDRAKGKFLKPHQRKNTQQSIKIKVQNLQNALEQLKTE